MSPVAGTTIVTVWQAEEWERAAEGSRWQETRIPGESQTCTVHHSWPLAKVSWKHSFSSYTWGLRLLLIGDNWNPMLEQINSKDSENWRWRSENLERELRWTVNVVYNIECGRLCVTPSLILLRESGPSKNNGKRQTGHPTPVKARHPLSYYQGTVIVFNSFRYRL